MSLLKAMLPLPFIFFHVSYWTHLVKENCDTYDTIAASAGICAIYILDRVKLSPEDANSNYACTVASKRYVGVFVSLFACCCGVVAYCAFYRPHLWAKIIVANTIVIWYSVEIPIIHRRIINLFPFSKILFVSCIHAWWPFYVTESHGIKIEIQMCVFFSFVLAVTFMDIKDIKADRRYGIITVANYMGNTVSRLFVIIGFCGLAFFARTFINNDVYIAYTITACIQFYHMVHHYTPGLFALWSFLLLPVLVSNMRMLL